LHPLSGILAYEETIIAYDNTNMETEDDEEEILLVGNFHISSKTYEKSHNSESIAVEAVCKLGIKHKNSKNNITFSRSPQRIKLRIKNNFYRWDNLQVLENSTTCPMKL
jgi:hypothetical protein